MQNGSNTRRASGLLTPNDRVADLNRDRPRIEVDEAPADRMGCSIGASDHGKRHEGYRRILLSNYKKFDAKDEICSTQPAQPQPAGQ